MKCPGCAHENAATMTYCKKCGGVLDLTADQIQDALHDKAKGETAEDTAFRVRRLLVGSIVLFLVAMTLFVISGGKPEEAYHVPSVSTGGKYLEYGYRIEQDLDPMKIPVE